MDMTELKKCLYTAVARFFRGATVVWAEQIQPQPRPPYLTLKTGRINRTAFALESDDGNRYYQADTTLEINLYTGGAGLPTEENVLNNFINTAVGDLTDFFLYLESDAVQDDLSEKGISIQTLTPPTDASALINDIHFKFRAMAELTVAFPMTANGLYGVSDMPDVPNYSGGATIEMVTDMPSIEDVDIEQEQLEQEE